MILRMLNAHVLYGLAERWQGRRIGPKLAVLRRELALPPEERRRRQQAKLAEVIAAAGASVPYYRDLFARVGFQPAKVAGDAAYLQELPTLTKDILRGEGERLLRQDLRCGELHVRKTGGSTGPAATIYYDSQALDYTAAVKRLVLERIGKRRTDREAHLSSRFPETFPWKDRLKERIKCAAMNRLNVLTDCFDDEGLERIWRRLRRIRPRLVEGHPSTMYALARYLDRRGEGGRGAVGIFGSTGETLDDKKRRCIENVLGCRVVNWYGNAEFGVVAYEDPADAPGRMRVLEPVVFAETIEAEGGRRELVLTGLLNSAMPLIRYRTGDLAELTQDERGQMLTDVCGRVHDVVPIGDRTYPTHYVQDLLDRIGGVDEFQIELRPGRPPLLRIVPSRPEDFPAVQRRIQGWWGKLLEVQCASLEQLRRVGWREKFRYLVPAS